MNKFIQRLVNFIRPKPQYIKMPVEEILKNKNANNLIQSFNDFYYSSGNSGNLNWCGDPMIKNPCDIWVYIEIFQELKPSIIIETGTHRGASANFFADMCKILKINISRTYIKKTRYIYWICINIIIIYVGI